MGERGRRPAPPRSGLGVNRGTRGDTPELVRLPRAGDGAHLSTRPVLLAWHWAREGQALVGRAVSHQRVGLRKGPPASSQEVGAHLFFCLVFVFLYLLTGFPQVGF